MKTFKQLWEDMGLFRLFDNRLTEEMLYEMARLQQANTGLPYQIFVSTRDYGTGNHWARVKISNIPNIFSKNDNFSVSIENNPRVVGGKSKYKQSDMNDIFDWIVLNQEVLLKYWNNQFKNDVDFYHEIQPLVLTGKKI